MKNGIMLQTFEWYSPDDGSFYTRLADQIPHLAAAGFTGFWLPPCFKANGGTKDVGYGVYDLWDLGEFDQKGAVRTKYGTKGQYLHLIDTIHQNGCEAYADIVLNHKGGADYTESFEAVQVDAFDRLKDISDPHEIEGWTGFNFPGRAGVYSDFVWNYNHFSGIDYDEKTDTEGIFRIVGDGKYWDLEVSQEMGNYDYLMFADIDHSHPEVQAEIALWTKWFIKETGIDGFRFDALKHIDYNFIDEYAQWILDFYSQDFYFIGEYWVADFGELNHYLDETDYNIDLFDVRLHFHFQQISDHPESFDLRTLFDHTLVQTHPLKAVTFVDNHDSQPSQALESWVKDWFKESAYAIILLREEGYPCIFAGDYFGIGGDDPIPAKKDLIDPLIKLRRDYAYGPQKDYYGSESLMGFVRLGDQDHPAKLAVLISTGEAAQMDMFVGEDQAGKTYIDFTGKMSEEVLVGQDGTATFLVGPQSVTCWIEKK